MCSCKSCPAAPAAPGVRDQTPSRCLRTPTVPFRLPSTGSVCWQGFLEPGVGLCSKFMFGSGCWDGGAGDRACAVHGAPRAAPPRTAPCVCWQQPLPPCSGSARGSGPKLHPLYDRGGEAAWKSHCSLFVRVRDTSQSHAEASAPTGTWLVKPGPGHQDCDSQMLCAVKVP